MVLVEIMTLCARAKIKFSATVMHHVLCNHLEQVRVLLLDWELG